MNTTFKGCYYGYPLMPEKVVLRSSIAYSQHLEIAGAHSDGAVGL